MAPGRVPRARSHLRPSPRLAAVLLLAALVPPACGTLAGPAAMAAERPPALQASPLYHDGAPWAGPPEAHLRHAEVLTARDPAFGGWSGLAVQSTPEETRLLAVSDHGFWMRVPYNEADGRLGEPLLGRLTDLDGTPLRDDTRRDAEELVLLDGGGAIVSFERDHRLWLYPPPKTTQDVPFTSAPVALSPPPGLKRLSNTGMEAVALLPDGRLAVLIEGSGGAPTAQGWLGTPARSWDAMAASGHPAPIVWWPFSLPLSDPAFRPTAAAADRHALYVLERAFSMPLGFRCRLRRIPLEALPTPEAAGTDTVAASAVQTLVDLNAPPATDNFEGLAVRPRASGSIATLITDDNYSGLQRTLLLSLALP